MPIRWELGPVHESLLSPDAPIPAPVAVKPDVDVVSLGIEDWKIKLSVPAYNLSDYNHLVRLRAYLIPEGQPLPGAADALVASEWPFVEADTTGLLEGITPILVLPSVPPASRHSALVVRGFDQ